MTVSETDIALLKSLLDYYPGDFEARDRFIALALKVLPPLLEEREQLKKELAQEYEHDCPVCAEKIEQQLAKAQAEVELLTLFIEIDIPRIITSRLNELKQALNLVEAK